MTRSTEPDSNQATAISSNDAIGNEIPSISASAVLMESGTIPESHSTVCKGADFDQQPRDLDTILDSCISMGFQATNFGLAIQRIQEMRNWRLSDVPLETTTTTTTDGTNVDSNEEEEPSLLEDPSIRKRIRARIFLAYTSNQISSGQREIIRFLVQHRMVDVIITTAGGIEEDIIKCLKPTYVMGKCGDGSDNNNNNSGRQLRQQGLNRIGNLIVPNHNYCVFEDWLTPLLNTMHDEFDAKQREWVQQVTNQKDQAELPPQFQWSPSTFIHRLGRTIQHRESVLYWASVHNIPVFCPALTDGSIGDMLYFHSYKRPGFTLDIVSDIRRLNDLAVRSHCTGQIILGGGLVKHHTNNANLMRNGADYSVYINTGHEYDGSDSGASPDEAISWGKIRMTAQPVKITADATLVFPWLVAATFAKNVPAWKESVQGTVCWVGDLESEQGEAKSGR
jgi:deoxyhypusine synthase